MEYTSGSQTVRRYALGRRFNFSRALRWSPGLPMCPFRKVHKNEFRTVDPKKVSSTF